MRITYFINQYPHVSHTFIRREILELEKQGFEIQRIALRGWDSSIVDETDKNERERTNYILYGGLKSLLPSFTKFIFRKPKNMWTAIKMVFRMTRMSERNILYHFIYLMEACRLANETLENGSEHVHAHFGTNSTEVVLLANLLTNIPYSFTVHGPEEFDKPLSLHLREKIRHSKFVCAISSFGRSQLFRWADYNDWNKVKIVRCGLDNSFLQGQPVVSESKNVKQLLCIGRLCEQKGQLLLLQSLKEVLDCGHQVKLILAGDGDMRPEIERFVSKHGLQNNVEITGWISSIQVKQYLVQSDAMILPSFAEGLPVAIMEAMSVGRPVITTYIAGIPELITNKENGFLFAAGDITAIKNAIINFLRMSDKEHHEMVSLAYKSVDENHNIVSEAKKLGSLIRETL